MKHGRNIARAGAALVSTLALIVPLMVTAPAAGAVGPSVRLVGLEDQMRIVRRREGRPVNLYLDVFAAAVGGPFEIRTTRPDYAGGIHVEQWADGALVQDLTNLDGSTVIPADFSGLHEFVQVSVTDEDGEEWMSPGSNSFTMCPDPYSEIRLDDSGPISPSFPNTYCQWHEFGKGYVHGIDQGWAMWAFRNGGYFGRSSFPRLDAPDGDYTVNVSLGQAYQDAFGVTDPADTTVTIDLVLKTRRRSRCGQPVCSTPDARQTLRSEAGARAAASSRPLAAPIVGTPPQGTAPDLRVTPSFNIRLQVKRNGAQYLAFGSNAWNEGPGQFLIEGFHDDASPETMDSWQYFIKRGEAVGKALIGEMEYHEAHHHWHFKDFARYALVTKKDIDNPLNEVVRSKKVSFCLAATDPIDMTVRHADWGQESQDIWSVCGGKDSPWIREALPVGWGDTYYQYYPGQSFNVTDLPNGRYFVAVEVNPRGNIMEQDTTNNWSYRKVLLRGVGKHRRVIVPAFEDNPDLAD